MIFMLQPYDVKTFQLQIDIPSDYPLEVKFCFKFFIVTIANCKQFSSGSESSKVLWKIV
jgi:hypothetical protein